ncbi:MAG: hypothetical protein E7L01_03140 [Paenibacillus macerans]|uniref:hypothetical protein n=1 Tax=Paenibacillus TaxID=44249 RepID=UPI00290BDD9C|nr:hypothetical protein [Paenibacillus macerans]MDU7472344.1 hypothetical protein [Paenibacillus macerans]
MKKKELRRFTILFAVAVLGLGSGCGTPPGNLSAAVDIQEKKASVTPQYKISWTMHQNLPVPEDAEMVRYVEDKFHVDLDVWNLENNKYEALLDIQLAQGAIPDLFRIRQPQDLLKYQQQGLLAEIPEDKLIKYAPYINFVESNQSHLKA